VIGTVYNTGAILVVII